MLRIKRLFWAYTITHRPGKGWLREADSNRPARLMRPGGSPDRFPQRMLTGGRTQEFFTQVRIYGCLSSAFYRTAVTSILILSQWMSSVLCFEAHQARDHTLGQTKIEPNESLFQLYDCQGCLQTGHLLRDWFQAGNQILKRLNVDGIPE